MNRVGITPAFMCLSLWCAWTCASEPAGEERTRYPTFGVAFSQPKGWIEQTRDKSKTVAWWISPDSARAKPLAIIMVECAQTPAHSLDEVARGLAENLHGVVDGAPTTLGGTRALRVVAKNDGRTVRPVEALATIHDKLLYLVMGGAVSGRSVKNELEAIRASWDWTAIEPPYKHLAFRAKPFSLAAGAATINVPALMHIYPNEHPDRVLDLGLHNVLRNESDFLAYAQVVTMAEGQSFADYRNRLSERLRAQGTIQEPIAWQTREDDPSRVVSQTIQIQVLNKAGEPRRMLIRWALVRLDDRRIVSVNFTVPDGAPEVPGAYSTLMDRIVDSIQPGVGGRPD
jgi:hypothetical protein